MNSWHVVTIGIALFLVLCALLKKEPFEMLFDLARWSTGRRFDFSFDAWKDDMKLIDPAKSGYEKNMLYVRRDGEAKVQKRRIHFPFQEVRRMYGHEIAPQDTKPYLRTGEKQYPSKMMVDASSGNYYLPSFTESSTHIPGDPMVSPSDAEVSHDQHREDGGKLASCVHGLKDVRFLITDN